VSNMPPLSSSASGSSPLRIEGHKKHGESWRSPSWRSLTELLLVVGLALLVVWILRGSWIDPIFTAEEGVTYWFAADFLQSWDLGPRSLGPLYQIWLAGLLKVSGPDHAPGINSGILIVGTTLATHYLFRRTESVTTSLALSLFVNLNAALYSGNYLIYRFAFFLIMAGLCIGARTSQVTGVAILLAMCLLASVVRVEYVLVIGVLVPIMILNLRRSEMRTQLPAFAAVGVTIAACIALILYLASSPDNPPKTVSAFKQFYVESAIRIRGVDHYGLPVGYWASLAPDSVWSQDMGSEASLPDAAMKHPDLIAEHVLLNAKDLASQIWRLPGPIVASSKSEALIVVLGLLLIVAADKHTVLAGRRMKFFCIVALAGLPMLLFRVKPEYMIPLLPLAAEFLALSGGALSIAIRRLLRVGISDRSRTAVASVLLVSLVVTFVWLDPVTDKGLNTETDNGRITRLLRAACNGCALVSPTAKSYSAMIYPTKSVAFDAATKEVDLEYLRSSVLDKTAIIIWDRPEAWNNLPQLNRLASQIARIATCRQHEIGGLMGSPLIMGNVAGDELRIQVCTFPP